MLQREDLPSFVLCVLCFQPDLGLAVVVVVLWLHSLDRFENPGDRLAELEVRGIEQALVMIRVEYAVRRHQLEDLDRRVDLPAVRARAVAELLLRFGMRDVDPGLGSPIDAEEELECDGGLARAGAALEEVHACAGPAAGENFIEAGNAG